MIAAAVRIATLATGLLLFALSATTYADSAAALPGLQAPGAFAGIADRHARAVALFTEMGKVIQSPRCLNCHPRGDSPTQLDGRFHTPTVARGPDGHGVPGLECAVCHGPANVAFVNGAGGIPGHPDWHLAPRTMAWQGKSLGAICAQIKDRRRNGGKTLAQLQQHNARDSLVGWGWHPGAGRIPAPGSQQTFGGLTQAWIDAGASCPRP